EYQHSYVVVSDVIYSIIDPARNSSHRQTEYRYGGSLLAVEGKPSSSRDDKHCNLKAFFISFEIARKL
ncbi:MAG: hypothetical protein WBB29_23260, partial [Geitlerinemataceae cyanobacterium]